MISEKLVTSWIFFTVEIHVKNTVFCILQNHALSEPRVSSSSSAITSTRGKLHHSLPSPDDETPSSSTADINGDIAGGNVRRCSNDSSTLTPVVIDSSLMPVNLSSRNKDGEIAKPLKMTKFGVDDLLSSNHVSSRRPWCQKLTNIFNIGIC